MTNKKVPILYKLNAICPVKAIRMKEDEEGFEYPLIDEHICLNCKKCTMVCPLKN